MDRGDASALADLQMHWDEAYVIGLDGDIWSARYRTSADELRAHTCTELRELIRSDYAYRQKIDRAAEDPDEDDDDYSFDDYYEGDAPAAQDATVVTDGDLAPADPTPSDPILDAPGSDNPADGDSGTRNPNAREPDSGDGRQHLDRVGFAAVRGEGMSL